MCWPPSGVRVISWSRNCPNCMAMWVKPFLYTQIIIWFYQLVKIDPFLLSLGVLLVVLCIASDTLRGLMLTYHKICWGVLTSKGKLWLLVMYFSWCVQSIIIGSGSHSPHSNCRRSPVAWCRVHQVVALPVWPSYGDKVLAVNTFPATNLIGSSRKLRNWHFSNPFEVVLTSSKGSLSILIPSAFTDFLTASWSAMSRRLWMARTFVRLFTLTKGSFSLSLKVPFSRLMKAFKAPIKSFPMTSFCSLVTSQPMVSSTAGMLTSFPRSCGAGIAPAQFGN